MILCVLWQINNNNYYYNRPRPHYVSLVYAKSFYTVYRNWKQLHYQYLYLPVSKHTEYNTLLFSLRDMIWRFRVSV